MSAISGGGLAGFGVPSGGMAAFGAAPAGTAGVSTPAAPAAADASPIPSAAEPHVGLTSGPLGSRSGLEAVLTGAASPLAFGARGDDVRALQAALRAVGVLPEAPDGGFGRGTERALARFQRDAGLTPSGRADAETLYALDRAVVARTGGAAPPGAPDLDALAQVLSTAAPTSAAYHAAVTAWPASVSIYDHLDSREARVAFVRYLVRRDDTNTRPYQSFDNLCTGFAAQLYGRYSSRSTLDDASRAKLADANVSVGETEAKLRAPIFMATHPGHFFNAFLVEPSRPQDPASYVLFEPQSDELMLPGTAAHAEYATPYVSFVDLTRYDGRYETRDALHFAPTADGTLTPLSGRSVTWMLRDLFIADGERMNYDAYVQGRPFDTYLRERASGFSLTDEQLLEVARVARGRPFRSHPDAAPAPLDPADLLRRLGKGHLAARL